MNGACALVADTSGTSVLAAQGNTTINNAPASLVQYSLATFRAAASVTVTDSNDFLGACDFVSVVGAWSTDGIIISSFQHSGGGSILVFLHANGLSPVVAAAAPQPSVDASGIIRLAINANDLAFDSSRNRVWASVPGTAGQLGNTVVSIDPASGQVVDTIFAGSEPGLLALSSDNSRLFTVSKSVPAVSMLDLNAKQLTQTFSVMDSNSSAPISLAAVPGQNNSVAVVRTSSTISYACTITVYDSGTPRPNSFSDIKAGPSIGDPSLPFLTAIYPGDASNSFYAAGLQIQYGDGSHQVARLVVDANGIALDKQLTPLLLGDAQLPSNLVYDSGHLYTTGGQVWTPDIQTLQGTFSIQQSYAAIGIPVLFSDRNQVAYVYTSSLSNSGAITLFDLTTRRPVSTLALASTVGAPSVTTAVRAGAAAIAVAAGGQITLVPLASLQPWTQYAPSLLNVAPGVQRIDLPVNAIAAIPGTSNLAFATPSTDGTLGNSVVTFNTATNQVEGAVFAGSEPTLLAPAADGSAVYASLAGERRVARVNVASQTRDLVFTGDPKGGSAQYDLFDMASGADGGLAVSYYGGEVAIFDNGAPRPQADANTQGAFAYTPATFKLAFATSGSLLYGFNNFLSTFDMKRDAVSPAGVQWLSSVNGLIGGYSTDIRYAQGRLYTSTGSVIDPERSRIVGQFVYPSTGSYLQQVCPDPAAGRVYFTTGGTLAVFDSNTYAFLGSMTLTLPGTGLFGLVKYSDDGLATYTGDGHIYLVKISSIPLLPQPIPSPQPTLPSTAGVTLTQLTAADLAYDSSRNLLYASVPNSEGALGDHIAAIDPGAGTITATYPTDLGPRLLALSSDNSQLFYTSGLANNQFYNGFSFSSEGVRRLDLAAGASGPNFAVLPPGSDSSYTILALTALSGQPQSVAVINNLYQNVTLAGGSTLLENLGPASLRIYDNGIERPQILSPPQLDCTAIQPAATASRLYCASAKTFSKLAADSNGVTLAASGPLSQGTNPFTGMLFNGGRIYTTAGLVIDPEAMSVVATLPAQGPVAADDKRIYWLDPTTSTSANPNVTLRSFDAATLQALDTKQINVTAPDVTRLVVCGPGRLAFRAGHEIYIVNLLAPPPPVISPGGVVPVDGSTPVIQAGSWISIYGTNLAAGVAPWNNDFPTTLGGVTVRIDNKPAYLAYVSPSQINLQVPDDATTGTVTVALTNPNGSATASVYLAPFAPALLLLDSKYPAAQILTPDGSGAYGGGSYDLAGPAGHFSFVTRPVKAGEVVQLWGVGFGPTNPAVAAGQPFAGAAPTTSKVTVTIGGVPATVLFSGLSAAGLDQLNVVIPAVGSGDKVLQATVGGALAPPVFLTLN